MSIDSKVSNVSPKSDRRPPKEPIELSVFSISPTVEVFKPDPLSAAFTDCFYETQVNPEKMERGQDTKVNQLQLQLLLQRIFAKITRSLERFPPLRLTPLVGYGVGWLTHVSQSTALPTLQSAFGYATRP